MSPILAVCDTVCGCRLGLAEKLQLACTEKKGRAQAIQIDGASVMLPTGIQPSLAFWWILLPILSCYYTSIVPRTHSPASVSVCVGRGGG